MTDEVRVRVRVPCPACGDDLSRGCELLCDGKGREVSAPLADPVDAAALEWARLWADAEEAAAATQDCPRGSMARTMAHREAIAADLRRLTAEDRYRAAVRAAKEGNDG